MPRFVVIENGEGRFVSGAFTAMLTVDQAVVQDDGAIVIEPQVQEQQVPDGWLDGADDDTLAERGIWKYPDPEPPEGKQLTSTVISVVDGLPSIEDAWEDIPGPTLDELKAAARAAVKAKLASIFNDDGYTVTAGPLAGQVLQWRLSPSQDRTNWLTSEAAYTAAVAAGQGDVAAARFRTKANTNFTITIAEGLSAILGMAAVGQDVVARSWALFDQVDGAEAPEDLPSDEDIAGGWGV